MTLTQGQGSGDQTTTQGVPGGDQTTNVQSSGDQTANTVSKDKYDRLYQESKTRQAMVSTLEQKVNDLTSQLTTFQSQSKLYDGLTEEDINAIKVVKGLGKKDKSLEVQLAENKRNEEIKALNDKLTKLEQENIETKRQAKWGKIESQIIDLATSLKAKSPGGQVLKLFKSDLIELESGEIAYKDPKTGEVLDIETGMNRFFSSEDNKNLFNPIGKPGGGSDTLNMKSGGDNKQIFTMEQIQDIKFFNENQEAILHALADGRIK